MPTENKAADAQIARRTWTTPTVSRIEAGSAESGPGASGETNSLS